MHYIFGKLILRGSRGTRQANYYGKVICRARFAPKKNGIKIADYNMEMRGFYCPCPRKDKVSPGCNHIFINLFLFQRGGVQMLFLLLISLIVFAAVVVDLVALGADIIVGGGVLLLLLLLVCCW